LGCGATRRATEIAKASGRAFDHPVVVLHQVAMNHAVKTVCALNGKCRKYAVIQAYSCVRSSRPMEQLLAALPLTFFNPATNLDQ
jgi:hypothetical protein